MPYRNIKLVNDYYYHVFNRGVARLPVFLTKYDYKRFQLATDFYQYKNTPIRLSKILEKSVSDRNDIFAGLKKDSPKLVTIYSYALLPNHFHFLVKQNIDNGILIFMKNLTDSYSKYINKRHERVGPLWQGPFKAVRIESDEQLLHVSRYIHLNPVVGGLIKSSQISMYPWSSYSEYLNKPNLCDTSTILSYFKSKNEYVKFIENHIDYAKKLQEIKHLMLE